MTARAGPAASEATVAPTVGRWRGRLFRKYVLLLVGLVGAILLVNGVPDAWLTYQESKSVLIGEQQDKAGAAAQRIQQFIEEIERQIGWTTQPQWTAGSLEQRRFDLIRLLRQVPAITDISQLDAAGKEQIKISRVAMDVVGSQADYSKEPRFVAALANKIWFGPVYFRQESEPYMTIAMARSGREPGVIVAEVNLKLMWEIIASLKIGADGYAYVVDRDGRLIAHQDISLVLRNTNLATLPQVQSAVADQPSAPEPAIAQGLGDRSVLTAHARIAPLGWVVFVERPLTEALAPAYTSAIRTGLLLVLGLVLATLAALLLARRMVVPIRVLQEGAARIGAGELDQRITIHTGDELEDLAAQFNRMAEQLRESYGTLERKVEERTHDLARSIEELRVLGEVGRAVSSTLDLGTVLSTIVTRAVQLAAADAGAIFRYGAGDRTFRLVESVGWDARLVTEIRSIRISADETAMGAAAGRREPVQLPDLRQIGTTYPLRDLTVAAGFLAVLVVPLFGVEQTLGALVLQRRASGNFPPAIVALMQSFASQSALAIQNARLFREIAEKGDQLAAASRHKSKFLASMSHELRTPLNAILGYNELIQDEIYGPVPGKIKEVLERVQANGRHLLGLINDVLDLSKIEAGQLNLALGEYSMREVVQSAVSATEALAAGKKLAMRTELPEGPLDAEGDERRLTQVLLNLVGNAIKFTDRGEVVVGVKAENGTFEVSVADTGPGIPAHERDRIFEEFQQADSAITREKGGTGLGLSISKKIIELHGGRIWVESEPGRGSTFRFTLPLRLALARPAE